MICFVGNGTVRHDGTLADAIQKRRRPVFPFFVTGVRKLSNHETVRLKYRGL
jgi:hypothetical protein